ncbi:glycoside hydrolase [Saccharophagus sp. K07]|jgi:1,4-alpha-glucan branching enzyme|uniref:isoamylase early set domain-containing protein n=1 Tax=Saccharophagus sp. K07 TaxID=2283636 RepID=UPI00165256EC|nr:isoamylase early set domain-containing protein [Saccharophagus sp. K07]MBC6905944.1 glycoside hydrolase [Saccharophagus sp. K07]
MSLDKKYLKSKPICKVKFIAPAELAKEAKKIYLAGDFNNWEFSGTPLKKQKDGSFATTLELETGSEYEYRYVLDGERWENDYDADKYVPSKIANVDNSVVVV